MKLVLISLSKVVLCLSFPLFFWSRLVVAEENLTDRGDVFLEDYCGSGKEVTVVSNGRYGGKLQFFKYPQRQNCSVKVVIVLPNDAATKYGLYLNVAEATMPLQDTVHVFEILPNGDPLLKKTLRRDDRKKGDKATSVGQLRTDYYSGNITLQMQVIRNDRPVLKADQVIFEYSVVAERAAVNDSAWAFCPALKGYVDRKLACNSTERFTCPDIIRANTEGPNPATALDTRLCNVHQSPQIFRDDFEDGLSSMWSARTATRPTYNGTVHQRSENVYVSEGSLHVKASAVTDNATHTSYSVGHVSTGSAFSFQYGEIEIRAKLPVAENLSIITMMHLVDHGCHFDYSSVCQEQGISIADLRTNEPTRVDMGVNYGHLKEGAWIFTSESSLADLRFHVFKMSWTRDSIIWYVDDIESQRLMDPKMIPTAMMQILIEVDIFPTMRPVNVTSELVIDYIIVRQLPVDQTWIIWTAVTTVVLVVLIIVLAVFYIKKRTYTGNRMQMYRPPDDEPDAIFFTVDEATKKHITEMYYAWKVPSWAADLEIPVTALKFEHRLDQGEFGMVYKAVAHKLCQWPAPSVVAVKCARNFADTTQHKLLMDEVTIHSRVGRHLNIVNLLGIVLSGQLQIVLEFSPYGNLLKYLREHAKIFDKAYCENPNYLNEGFVDLTLLGPETNIPAEWPLKQDDLINFAYQISRGMEYLALNNIIHRDLAARNILVCEHKVLKICDFGLAKQKSEYYRMSDAQGARVPARWMAPESLDEKVSSEKSDVWSFGIVMWEIFSFGKVPYYDTLENLSSVVDIKKALFGGVRPLKPLDCPESIHDIMRQCWKYEATNRPTFATLSREIEPFVEKQAQSHYFQLDEPYVAFNLNHPIPKNADEYLDIKT